MLRSGHHRHFIRQWRKHRGLTLEKLAERIGMTHQNLGKIERYAVPATDQLLELLAEELSTDMASLVMRDPSQESPLWSIWDAAQKLTPDEQRRAVRLITAIHDDQEKSGTGG